MSHPSSHATQPTLSAHTLGIANAVLQLSGCRCSPNSCEALRDGSNDLVQSVPEVHHGQLRCLQQ